MEDIPKEIQKARIAMQFDHPFFGYLAITLEPIEKKDLDPPTMATDGLHLYYHPDFIKKLPLKQLAAVIAHEILHIVLHHLPRRMGREPLRWNFACDMSVNELVQKEFELPPGCLLDQDNPDKAAEWRYSNFRTMKGNGPGMQTLDSHAEWEGWGAQPGDGKSDKDGGNGPADGKDASDALEQEWKQRVATAETQARMQGKFPAHLESVVGELLQPKLDWKSILRDMITSCAKSDYRLMPPNKKHLWRGIYLPSIAGEEIRIAVAIDSSGSISDDEIQDFLSEVKGICDTYDDFTLHLLVADATVHQQIELHPFDPMPRTVQGRGGTSFVPAIREAEKLDGISSLVYFTDLYGEFPPKEPSVPVIWVCTTDVKPPWGYLIPYPQEERPRRRR